MTMRNLESRLSKLESIQRPDNSRFLIWYRGDAGQALMAARHHFPAVSDAIMAEWQSDGPLPANRWVKNFKADLAAAEREQLNRQLSAKAREKYDPVPPQVQAKLTEMTDTELWFEVLKVTHEPQY